MLLLLVGGQIQDFLSAPYNHPNQSHDDCQREWYNCIEPESIQTHHEVVIIPQAEARYGHVFQKFSRGKLINMGKSGNEAIESQRYILSCRYVPSVRDSSFGC
jgi:hypothetical protein